MSRTIDEKVVEMRFDNSNFEANVRQSMSTLDKLKSNLKFADSAKSFENIDRAANKVSFAGLNRGIDEVKTRISKLDMITNTVLSRMTNAAINFGTKIITAIPNQIKSGGWQRALNIENAKFQIEGLGKSWLTLKEDIDYAVDGTAYGLDVAAKAAAQLSASGIEAGDDMKKALRGISGVAAMTNSSYEEISPIFTSIAAMGKVSAMELNRISYNGLNAKAAIVDFANAVNNGTKEVEADIEASVKKMTDGAQITSETLTELITKGKVDFKVFSAAMDDAFGEHAKDANKTYLGALSNMKAALSRIGADFSGPMLVNLRDLFNQLRLNFNGIREALQPVVTVFTNLSTKIFKSLIRSLERIDKFWQIPSNKQAMLEGIATILRGLYERLEAVGKAFKEVFGGPVTNNVRNLANDFLAFSNRLRPSEAELTSITYIFKGLFTIIKGLGTAIKFTLSLLSLIGPKLAPIITVGGTIVLLIAVISKITSKLRIFGQMVLNILPLVKGLGIALLILAGAFGAFIGIKAIIANFDKIKDFFLNIGKSIKEWYQNLQQTNPVLYNVFSFLESLGTAVLGIFKKIGEFFKDLPKLFGQHSWTEIFNNMAAGLTKFTEKLKTVNVIEKVKGWIDKFADAFKRLGEKISNSPIFKKLTEFVNRIKNFVTGVKEVSVETGEVANTFRGAAKVLTGHNVQIGQTGDAIQSFSNKLAEFKEKVTMGKIAAGVFAATFTALIGTTASAVSKVGKGIQTVTGGIGHLTNSAGSLIDDFRKKIIGGFGKSKFTDVLKQFAILIGVIAASLAVLTTVDQEKLKNVAIILGIFTAVVAALAIVLKAIPNKGNAETIGLAGIGIALAGIAAALLILDKIEDVNGLIEKSLGLAIILGAIAGAMFIINKAGKGSIRSAVVILALGFALKNISELFTIINSMTGDPAQMATKIIGLIAVMLALGLLAAGIGQIRISTAIGLFLILKILQEAAPIIKDTLSKVSISEETLDKINEKLTEYRENILYMAGCAAGIITALGFAGKGLRAIATGFLFIAASFIIIGFALDKLTKIVSETDENTLHHAINILVGMMIFVGALYTIIGIFSSKDIGKNAVRLGAMMDLISVAMLILVGVVALLGNIPDAELERGLKAVTWIGAIVAGILVASHFAKDVKMGAVLAVLGSFITVAALLVILSFVPWQDLVAPIVAIGVILGGLALVFSQISKMKTTDKQGVKAMLFFIAVLAEIIGGVILISRLTTDWRNTIAATVAISGCLIALGVAMRIIAKTKISKANAENFAMAAKSLIWIGLALAANSFSNIGNIISTAGSIAGLCLLLCGALKIIQKNKITKKQVEPFVDAVKALALLTAALGATSISSPEKIISTAGAIAIIIGALVVCLLILEKWGGDNVEDNAKAMLKATLALLPVVGALVALSLFAKELTGGQVAALGIIFGAAMAALFVLTKFTDTDKLGDVAGDMFLATMSLIPVVISLVALAKYAKDLSAGQVAALGIIFGAAAAALFVLTKFTSRQNVGSRAKALLVATISLLPVVASLVALSKLAQELKVEQVIELGVIFGAVAAALFILTKFSNANKVIEVATALLIGTIALIPVAGSLIALSKLGSNINFDIVMYLLGSFATVVAALILLTKFTEVGDVVLTATGMLIATISLIPVAIALVALGKYAGDLRTDQVLSMVGLIAEVAIALGLLTVFTGALDIIGTAAAMVIACFSLIEVAYAFKILADVLSQISLEEVREINTMLTEWMGAIAALTFIFGLISGLTGNMVGIGMIAVAGAFAIMAFAVVELATAFTIASFGFKIFVPVLEQFIALLPQLQEAMSWDMVGAMVQLAIGLAAIGAAGIVAGIGAIGLWAFGAALTSTFIPGIMSLTKLGSEDITLVGQKIEELMASLEPLKGIGLILIPAAIAFALLGVALMTAGIGINQGAQGLAALAPALMLLKTVGDVGSLLTQIGLGLMAVGAAGIILNFGAQGLVTASTALPQIFEALANQTLGTEIGTVLASVAQGLQQIGLAGLILSFGGTGLMMAAIALKILGPALQSLNNADLANLGPQIKILADNAWELAGVGMVLSTGAAGMTAMGTGLLMLSNGLNAATIYFKNVKAAIDDIFAMDEANRAAEIIQKYQDIGAWIPESIANGIYNNMNLAITAAQEMASAVEEVTRDVLEIHSDSPKFNDVGGWVPRSTGNGITNNIDAATGPAGDMASGIIQELVGGLQDKLGEVEIAGVNLGDAVGDGLLPALDGVVSSAQQKINTLVSTVKTGIGLEKTLTIDSDANRKNYTRETYGMHQMKMYNSYVAESTDELDRHAFVVNKVAESQARQTENTKWLNGLLDENSEVIEEVEEAAKGAMEGFDGMSGAMDSAGGSASSAKDSFSELKDTIEGQMDLFSEFNMKTEMTGEQMLNNMRSQIQGISTWASNMQQLALRGMAPGLLKKLGDLGPQGFEKVNAFMQMSQEQLAEANSLYAQSLVLPSSAAAQVGSSYGYAGQMAGQGFADGLGGFQEGIDTASPYFQGVVAAPQIILDSHSPSRVMDNMGYNASLGFQLGWNKGNIGLLQAIETTITRMVEAFKTYTAQGGPFTLIGQSIQQAILNGITNAGTMMNNAMTTTGDSMGSALSGNPLLTAFLGSFTYDNGLTFLDAFIMGIKDSINTAFGIGDESSTWSNELFLMLLQGILDSLEENYEDFEGDLDEKFLTPIKEKIEEYISYDAGYELAENIADGLIDGLNDKLNAVREAAADLGNAVTAGTSGAVKVASPSKVFRMIGYYIDKGLALGIKENTYIATRSTGYLADNITTRMNNVVSTIYSMINSNIDMQPTIAPVIDTTNIVNGARAINGIFASTNRNASITASGYNEMLHATKIQADLSKSSESRLQRDYAQAIIDAVNNSANTDTNLTVVLDGDAGKVFNLVRTENNKFINTTNFNPLAQGRG